MNRVIVISGPTASGKTDIAHKLAKKHGGIIVNADSRQIYRDLNIGTAKPIPQKISKDGTWYIENIPYLLFGFASLESEYNIFKYQKDFQKILIKYPNMNIFLVGGTGLYIDSIIHGYILPQHKQQDLKDLDISQLQQMVDEKIQTLNESDRQNPRRLISLIKSTTPPSKNSYPEYLYLVIDVPKEILNQRIEERVEKMFEQGLKDENEAIYAKYPNYDLPSLNTIGYKEFKEYFEGNLDLNSVKELVITHTKQYSKRQRTWFKRNKEAIYIDNFDKADQAVSNFLRNL